MNDEQPQPHYPQRYTVLHYLTALWLAAGFILWIYLWPRGQGHTAVETAPAWMALLTACFGASISGVGAAILGELRRRGGRR